MVAVLREEPHFEVPPRLHQCGAPADGNPARLLLADRIARLPRIRTVDNGPEALPTSVTVFVENDHAPARKRHPPMTLCVISREGMTVHGLSLRDRRHLVMRGWGEMLNDRVQVFLPRNPAEVDVCWTILQHAHCFLLDISARLPGSRQAKHGDLPRFSRTTLQ